MKKHCCDMMTYYLQDEDDIREYWERFDEYVSHEEIEAAWAFYLRYRIVIDNRLAKNEADS